jgi:hypothetical protein
MAPAEAHACHCTLAVSRSGGRQPRWRNNGTESFYLSPATHQLMAVRVNTAGAFEAREPKPLLDVSESWNGRWRYDVSPDGQRFLVGEQESERSPEFGCHRRLDRSRQALTPRRTLRKRAPQVPQVQVPQVSAPYARAHSTNSGR